MSGRRGPETPQWVKTPAPAAIERKYPDRLAQKDEEMFALLYGWRVRYRFMLGGQRHVVYENGERAPVVALKLF